MKNFINKYKYIMIYIIIMFILFIIEFLLNSGFFIIYKNIKIISNPIIFLTIDFILLNIILRKVEMLEYKTQKRIMRYFNTINNLYIFIIILLTGGVVMSLIEMGINMVITYFNRPLTPDPSVINGVEDYFNKHQDKKSKKYYKSKEEVRDSYKKLENEIIEELPKLDKEVKEQNKEKTLDITSKLIFIIPVILLTIGFIANIIEIMKTYERGNFKDYEISINNNKLDIRVDQSFNNVVIPIVYIQKNNNTYFNGEKDNIKNIINKENKYILNIKENICVNNRDDRIACNLDKSLYEYKKESKIKITNMEINNNNNNSYDGKFINDITNYLEEGDNEIIIHTTSKKDNLEATITFNIVIEQ